MTATSASGDKATDKYGGTQGSPVTYNKYLRVHDLKELQVCLSDPPHHDEPLFIIIHQTYELWFKLVLHELDTVQALLAEDNVRRANFFLRRVVAILKLLVQQIHILETMSPQDFLGFRHNLNPASGFQSSQFREVEFTLGAKDERMLEHFKPDAHAYESLKKCFAKPSVLDSFNALLKRKGFALPEGDEDARVKELAKLYKNDDSVADLTDLAELLVEIDELVYLWRVNHVTVVERIIGFKRGTGGSEGVGYLQSTLTKRCFPDLWKVRTVLE